MNYRITVREPVVKRGWFGRKKTVYVERTVIVDAETYRRMLCEQRERETDSFLDFIEEAEMLDAIFDD